MNNTLKLTFSDYIVNAERITLKKSNLYSFLYYTFSLFSIFAGLAATISSAFIVAKIAFKTAPLWYWFMVTSMSAIASFSAAMISFFTLRHKMKLYRARYDAISYEIILFYERSGIYKGETTKYKLFKKVSEIMRIDRRYERKVEIHGESDDE
ncbi:MAG: DUF4231 domain-containing protein [Mycoplasma sp.]|nr:DUF4231 domain-containing protein [Mycoplasma sp.]